MVKTEERIFVMKQNGNNKNIGDYYLGLDIGTNSVGWAVTDLDYSIPKFKGNAMWGIRLFDDGNTAAERRTNRTNRRRLARRKWRLELLRKLFDAEITKVDPGFFQRMAESALVQGDKTTGTTFSLFADKDFNDKTYHKTYPTIYHLRYALMTDPAPHDVRLVYLALHSLFKARGHFLYDIGDITGEYVDQLKTLLDLYTERTGFSVAVPDADELHKALASTDGKTDKFKKVKELISVSSDELEDKEAKKATEALAKLLSGGKASLADLFADKELGKLSAAASDSEESLMEVEGDLGDNADVVMAAKAVYDSLLLERITGHSQSISEYKVGQYEQHRKDIQLLKAFIKDELKDMDLYREVFKVKKEKLTNYSAYSGYKKGDRECSCSQEDFCKYLSGKLKGKTSADTERALMLQRIAEGTFAPKLRGKENGVLPIKLQQDEVTAILKNASAYLPFLLEKDADGITVADKILATFRFRIPYYVGPLSPNAKSRWAVRKPEPVTPWNFAEVVDEAASAEGFITNLTSACTYTGDDVLPKDSLLYSRFTVLNEINNLRLDGRELPVEEKQKLFEALFLAKNRKVTKKAIKNYLVSRALCTDSTVISGVDETLTSNMASYHKLSGLVDGLDEATQEEIIRRIVLFGDDRRLLQKWLKENVKLPKEKREKLARIRFTDWGRLSSYFLTGIYHIDDTTGEAANIMELLWTTNQNLMQLLSDKYTFQVQANDYRMEKYGISDSPFEALQGLYVSPAVRRSIWQTMRIVDEITDIRKAAPKKIFIEVARDQNGKNEKKRTESRKDSLLRLYKLCKKDSGPLFEALNAADEGSLRSDKLYLYYTQFGKCMYSGDEIDIASLGDSGVYDIDHIYPRSRIKDDSLTNRVLVKAELNREKTNVYPISGEIRTKMTPFWIELHKQHLISDEKLKRLTRSAPLTEEELSAFVARQLVETRQSTKAVAELLKSFYPKSTIVYSKAGNVSEFRQQFSLVKCREINDLHHAKDAYLNVVVGNYFDTRFTKRFFSNILSEQYSLNPKVLYNATVKGAWTPGEDGTIATVRRMMAKNNIRYTRPCYEVGGALYDLQIVKAGKGQIPVKAGRPIESYGGYNKPTGTYFALVEHTEKGKTIRTLEAVYLTDKVKYEANPEAYACAKWYPDAKVIVKTIPMGSLFEMNGTRMHITGRTDIRVLYNHACQLIADSDTEHSIKQICKYVARCTDAKEVLPITKYDGITPENNVKMYDFFYNKICNSAYSDVLKSMRQHMEKARGVFLEMQMPMQCRILVEMLRAFRCNAEHPNFSELCGVKTVGIVRYSMKISEVRSISLVHQSVTGLFEYKVDLLK